MISLEDCIALSGLTEEEILAIAEHEKVPEEVAAGLARYLVQKQGGFEHICTMIIDDIRAAQQRADRPRTRELLHVLHHYLTSHPDAKPAVHPWSMGG
ncbi:MAG: hypothetical protein ACMVY4_18720 [Minwuia sp.]|uniref:hypothetical protein n=1 Tax=Minwuia sp. TaxID=2493630 RepID=UPI003A867B9A